MNDLAVSGGTRHVYRLKGWQRGLYLVLGLLVGGMGCAAVSIGFFQAAQDPSILFIGLLPLGIGGYLTAYAINSRLEIDGNRIVIRYAFRERSADLSEIEGLRTVRTRNSSFRQLRLKDGRKSISIINSFQQDDDLRAWFQQLTDLDEVDRKKLLDEIAQQQDLGATPEERLYALKRAKDWNVILSAVAIAAAVGLYFGSLPMRQLSAVALVLVPAAMLYLVRSQPLLYTVFKPKHDPRTDISLPLAAGAALLLGGRGVAFVSRIPLALLTIFIVLVFVWALLPALRGNPLSWGSLTLLTIFAGMYGIGLAMTADTLADRSPAVNYAATIAGKHISRGKSTTYYLDLAPWGPVQHRNQLSVSQSMYRNISPGEVVCLELRSGALHAAWYRMVPCAEPTFEQP